MDTSKLKLALQWREDVASGEMIEQRMNGKVYTRTHLGFKNVSQDELDNICETANTWWEKSGSDLRIGNLMGEIIPNLAAAEPTRLTFGKQLIGTWFCNNSECDAKYYPKHLREQELNVNEGAISCPTCNTGHLIYDEAA